MMSARFPDQGAIRRAIETVFDPCSVNAGVPINVIDMGLVLGWTVDADGDVEIRMRLTSPGCTLAPSFMHRIELAVNAVEHVRNAQVKVTGLGLWSEADVAPDKLRELRETRMASQSLIGTRPRQWQSEMPTKSARPSRSASETARR